ncbi:MULTISPECIES: L,D-transpeptidase [Lonsdalea]|uniref:Murein L,D-transpeptidase n=1 Tax=Lonsdalea quercina TaxID=71657 RepID=A0ACD1J8S1_9GAMM|nr:MULTISPECIES: L,D-transpeptidase [Lonsdalea]OSN02771.1 murein L,D-transpeptidase [Lonsdalea populi]QPQ25465.1 L,D-transpeptidase [Lonsdalea populi]RAT10914.1 murein L,D-transpeptidase [Lonsdalea quercina]RAT23788.1 murein L,D-transpeptidase [Lonsdalea populi]RAT27927.1 murein L,D-transpeptidase [Lonsdalea populi]
MLLAKRKTQGLQLGITRGVLWLGGLLAFSAQAATQTMPSGTTTPISTAAPVAAGLREPLPAGMALHYDAALRGLYAQMAEQPMWSDSRAVNAFQQQLAELALAGIQPQFTTWVTWLTDPTLTGLARDRVLSDAMLGYLQFVSGVEKNGSNWLYANVPYTLSLPPSGLITEWQNAVKEGRSAAFVATLAPRHSQYVKMHEALKAILLDNRPWPRLQLAGTLRPGDQSSELAVLQEILQRTGMLTSNATTLPLFNESPSNDGSASSTPAKASNVYTGELVNAVKRFQHWHGLQDDGAIGKRTKDWLNVSSQMRATLLALNIQRLRLIPDNVSTGILVNIPNFSLTYYENGAEILSSRVIVGQPKRKTPMMSSALVNVVVNPPWNVPTTLIRQDIIPKVIMDPGYLQRHGYTLLSDWSENAQPIDPSMIDWSQVSAERFPYRLRQAPGSTNSLGRYKFNMPNSEAIYLHDTPNHNLFHKDIRALSSGCVRVNKAAELAGLLLRDAGWNSARVSSTVEEGNTTYVSMRKRIPVSLYYLTAWVAEDGKAQYRTDIYNYDGRSKTGETTLSKVGLLLQ